jgi:hypothetical protein
MHCNMIRVITLNFILRFVSTGVVRVPLIIGVLRVNLDDSAADMPGFGIPGHVIADFKTFRHVILRQATVLTTGPTENDTECLALQQY